MGHESLKQSHLGPALFGAILVPQRDSNGCHGTLNERRLVKYFLRENARGEAVMNIDTFAVVLATGLGAAIDRAIEIRKLVLAGKETIHGIDQAD